MKRALTFLVLTAIAGVMVLAAQQAQAPATQEQQGRGQRGQRGQQTAQPGDPAQPPARGADPYANNATPGTLTFPLAAPAGTDSNAKNIAPKDAVNQGAFDPAAWKYGPAFNPPPGAKV